MSTAADILKEEHALGRWPRRLLHVDTLTSHEWQPGNRYGPAIEPQYAAITYTWGRWKLKANEMSGVCGIPIRGVPWEIPRVDPLRFAAHELETVLIRARTLPSLSITGIPQRIDFVWLDIACIDQREDSQKAASEIGRQADIFRGASVVYAWLSALVIQQLDEIFDLVIRQLDDIFEAAVYERPNPEAALDALSALTSDPWFSSLWTLQEAFLRTDAVFLSRDAQIALAQQVLERRVGKFRPECFTLRTAVYFVNDLKLSGESGADNSWSQPTRHAYDKAIALGEQTGLYALSMRNAVGTFILAQNRKAEREEDRIYGIQQIFNFRLGKTAPGCTNHVYSLKELEDQFAKQLLSAYPVQSQIHVFTQAAKFGSAWRLNASSTLPKMNDPYFPWLSRTRMIDEDRRQLVQPTCKLWTEESDGNLWGCFSGKACNFNFWAKWCKEVDDKLMGVYSYLPILTIFLDVTDEVSQCPFHGSPATHLPVQRDLIEWLNNEFPSGGLRVLELGKRRFSSNNNNDPSFDYGPRPDSDNGLIHGLLLVPKQAQHFHYFHRVGFCTWYEGSLAWPERAELESEWKELNGRFG